MVVVGAALLTGCSTASPASAPDDSGPAAIVVAPTATDGAVPSTGTVLDQTLPAAVRELRLKDQDGRMVSLASLAGRTVVLSPNLTLCQEFCPLISANLARVTRDVDAAGLQDRVDVLEVTVDPQRDDQRHLKAYQGLFGAEPNWEFLGGTSAQITAFWKAFHLDYGREPEEAGEHPKDWLTGAALTYDVDHQNIVYILGPDGHIRWLTSAAPFVNGEKIPGTLEKFLNDEGHQNEQTEANPDWTAQDVDEAVSYVAGSHVG